MPCVYHNSYQIDAPLEKVWAFFEQEDAFEKLNPPFAKAELVKKTGGLQKGAEVHLKLPLGVLWVVQHTAYEKPHFFVDEQVRGPFRLWKHRHGFERVSAQKTRLTEAISFSLPCSWVLNPILGWWVKRQLHRLFEYRKTVLQNELS